jgi:hypothetical protein
VAMMVLLVSGAGREICLREELVHKLARLGVTDVAVVRDDRTVGIVLEGWLFDPARDARAIAEAIGAATRPRALHPVMHLAVSAASHLQRS